MSKQAPALTEPTALPDAPGLPGALWCWPGPATQAAFVDQAPEDRRLVIFCDPFSLILTVPPGPAGPPTMVGLLRQLAHEAAAMATAIESDSSATTQLKWGRP